VLAISLKAYFPKVDSSFPETQGTDAISVVWWLLLYL